MPLKAGNFSLQPSSTDNSGRAWPVECLLDFWTSHEATCTSSLLFTHWSCRQHSSSILHQIATFDGGRYFTWISHFLLSYFSPAAILDLWTGWISPFLKTCPCYRESTSVYIYISLYHTTCTIVGPVFRSLVDPPEGVDFSSPRQWGRGRRPPSALSHILRIFVRIQYVSQMVWSHFSISDIQYSAFVYLHYGIQVWATVISDSGISPYGLNRQHHDGSHNLNSERISSQEGVLQEPWCNEMSCEVLAHESTCWGCLVKAGYQQVFSHHRDVPQTPPW